MSARRTSSPVPPCHHPCPPPLPTAPPALPRLVQSPGGGGDLGGPPVQTAAQKIVAFKEAFWKFLRPHTIRGTILGSSAVTAMALLESSSVGVHGRAAARGTT